MEWFIRYVLRVFLSGIIVLAGIGITLFSIVSLVGFSNIHLKADPDEPLGTSVVTTIFDSFEFAVNDPAYFFLPPLLWIWLIFVGLVVLGYGIRRIARNFIDGVPASATRAPQTASALMVSTAAYLLGVFITLPHLVSAVYNSPVTIPAVFFSVETEARAVDIWSTDGLAPTLQKRHFVKFDFLDRENVRRQAIVEIPQYLVSSFQKSPDISISYLPASPDIAYLSNYLTSPSGYIWAKTWRLAMLYVAVCALMRNFGFIRGGGAQPDRAGAGSPESDKSATMPSPQPNANPARRPSAGRPRTQFGQRGRL